jgi:SAM-dependent methyltransferase
MEFEHPVTLWDHFDIAMVREYDHFMDTWPVHGDTYVQLGPGKKNIKGNPRLSFNWINLDFPEWDANLDPLPFDNESVHGICTYHAMDHFARPVWVLSEVQRVLVTGGWFVNVVGHYSSELANTCLEHRSRFGVDTWRNVFSTRQYDLGAVEGNARDGWHFYIGFNMIMALTERNTVLVTQLIKTKEVTEY